MALHDTRMRALGDAMEFAVVPKGPVGCELGASN